MAGKRLYVGVGEFQDVQLQRHYRIRSLPVSILPERIGEITLVLTGQQWVLGAQRRVAILPMAGRAGIQLFIERPAICNRLVGKYARGSEQN